MKLIHTLFSGIKFAFLQEKKRYLFVVILFLTGILSGSLGAAWTDAESALEIKLYFNRFFSAYTLQGIAKTEAFRLSLLNYSQLLFWLWLSGWSIWLLPMGVFQVILKGFRAGYTITYLIKCYHWKGIFVTVLALLPQNLILLPALCFYLVYLMHFSTDRWHLKKNTISPAIKKQIYGHHAIITLIFLLLLLFCAFIEGFVVPTLIQPFCGFFL